MPNGDFEKEIEQALKGGEAIDPYQDYKRRVLTWVEKLWTKGVSLGKMPYSLLLIVLHEQTWLRPIQ